jgi:hypothetical protein
MNALIGLTLVAMATTFMMQAVAASARAERLARERLLAMQWIAGALDELRVTGRVTSSAPPTLRGASLKTRRAPVPAAPLDQVTMEATWFEPSGARRTAMVTGILRKESG